jgi:hypothetical protein
MTHSGLIELFVCVEFAFLSGVVHWSAFSIAIRMVGLNDQIYQVQLITTLTSTAVKKKKKKHQKAQQI